MPAMFVSVMNSVLFDFELYKCNDSMYFLYVLLLLFSIIFVRFIFCSLLIFYCFILLCEYITFYVFILSSLGIWIVPSFYVKFLHFWKHGTYQDILYAKVGHLQPLFTVWIPERLDTVLCLDLVLEQVQGKAFHYCLICLWWVWQ